MVRCNCWLVTVGGHSQYVNPPSLMASVPIKLPAGTTPIDWFVSGPEVYNRTTFTPTTLVNFWSITHQQYKKLKGK